MITKKLETERLIVQRFEQNDFESIHGYMSDPNIVEHLPEDLFSKNDSIEFMNNNMGEHAENFALILKENMSLIGHMIFHKWFVQDTIEIGWVISSRHQCKGFASEAALQLLNYGFDILSAHRIIATCQPENEASWKVMEKIGMRKEGYFRKCIFRRGKWIDEFFYAILSQEWINK